MTEPTSLAEWNAKAVANATVSGWGLETAQHFPCPGCAEPDWKVVKIIEAQKALSQPSTCAHCGRSFKVLGDAKLFEFVQTGGPDLPDWMEPKMRRVDEATQPAKDITDPPTFVGAMGRAWRVDLDHQRRNLEKDRPETVGHEDATLDVWLIEAPYAHPFWHSYTLILVHLRPMADNRETVFHLKGATHEMCLYALNPEKPRQPYLDGDAGGLEGFFLTPKNFAAQLICENDAVARSLIEQAAKDIIDGRLNPDTDFIRLWADRFGGNMMRD